MKLRSPLRSGLRNGLIMGVVTLFITLIGMLQAFSSRALVGDITLTMVIIAILGLLTGYFAMRQLGEEAGAGQKILAGLSAGLVNGAMMAILLVIASAVNLRDILVNMTPELVKLLSFEQGVVIGSVILVVLFGVLSLFAVLLGLLPERLRDAILQGLAMIVLVGLFWEVLTGLEVSRTFMSWTGLKTGRTLSLSGAIILFILVATFVYFKSTIQRTVSHQYGRLPASGQKSFKWTGMISLGVVLIVLPAAIGQFWSQTLTTIGLFILMGLGLNIVVGLAGLLDLGYVAFYAIGAYAMALFSSPAASLGTGWSFWTALPLALVFGAFSGILLGIPVLRLRGDYLAIVTLGFGEIIRILALSDLLKPYIGGPQGILETPAPQFFGTSLKDPRYLYYVILAACLVVVFLSTRLNHSRIGRAWIAMREDEDVAQAMGINLVVAKLMAFSIGAAFAGVGGAIFASRQGAIFPSDFTLFISINVLCLIIIGGIGSIPGTVVGALFLVGLPEVLREVDEFRILAYGAGLVIMMIAKPEGLLPSARRRLELHYEEEVAAGTLTPTSADVATVRSQEV
jgi:branched-chain amino acid transport system permease protein